MPCSPKNKQKMFDSPHLRSDVDELTYFVLPEIDVSKVKSLMNFFQWPERITSQKSLKLHQLMLIVTYF